MSKQDRNGVRTAQDLERKYNLSESTIKTEKIEKELVQVKGEINQFAETTNKHFSEMQEAIEENITYRVVIGSSNGLVFKNGDIESVLTAKVYKGNEDITDQFTDTQFSWTRVSKDAEGDIVWNETHKHTKSITITNKDVYVKAIFNVILTLS